MVLFIIVVALAGTAWAAAAPDEVTLRTTRGTASAVLTGTTGFGRSLREQWRTAGPRRARLRTARRNRWHKTKTGRVALAGEHGLVLTARLIKSLAVATRDGARQAPAAYRTGATRATERRLARRTDQAATPTSTALDHRKDDTQPTKNQPQTDQHHEQEPQMPTPTRMSQVAATGNPTTHPTDPQHLIDQITTWRAYAELWQTDFDDAQAWAAALAEGFAGADDAEWSTKDLRSAAAHLQETLATLNPTQFLAGFNDSLIAMDAAADAAINLGDHAASVGAEGRVDAFTAA